MTVLALDTATLVSSVALATEDTLVAEITLQTKLTHSEVLMPHIAQILTMAQITKRQLSAIAVSIGPGSFTGLRIGLATAKTMAYALDIPVIGVPTLAALAYGCCLPGVIMAPLLDAQKGNVYTALYEWQDHDMLEVQAPHVLAFQDILEALRSKDKPVVVLGEGAVLFREEVRAAGGNIVLAPPHFIMPRAANVAIFGQQLMRQGYRDNLMTLEPLYIRRSEAEELWERRNSCQL